MVLAKISRRVKKLLRDNRRLDSNCIPAEHDRFARRTDCFWPFLYGVFERRPRSIQPAIAILEKSPHVRRSPRICQSVKRALSLDIPQIQRVRRVQINDASLRRHSSDAISASGAMTSNQLHALGLAWFNRRRMLPKPTVPVTAA